MTSPAVNPKGTVPALVVPYAHTVDEGISTKFKALCSTEEICDFLDRSTTKSAQFSAPALSPATIQNADLQKEIIARVHGDEVDPNALLLVWRDEAERKAKAEGLPATFLRGRQEALERYAREVSSNDAKLSEFYSNKLKENGGLLALLEGKGDSTEVQNKAKALWRNVGETLAYLEAQLDVKAPFLLGDQVSLAEYVLLLLLLVSDFCFGRRVLTNLPRLSHLPTPVLPALPFHFRLVTRFAHSPPLPTACTPAPGSPASSPAPAPPPSRTPTRPSRRSNPT